MTGLERNSEVVQMASYAPLFANIDAWQWAPDMIWVDNLKCYGSPDYYVQKLFSVNKGTAVVSINLNNQPATGQNGLYASAVLDQKSKTLIIKVVNSSDQAQQSSFDINGSKLQSTAEVEGMAEMDLKQVNSFNEPLALAPKKSNIKIKGQKLSLNLAPYSFNVIKIPLIK